MLAEADLWSKLGVTEAELNKKLSRTKVKLYFEKGAAFLGSLMSRLKFRWDWSIETAATDGVSLFWNPAFFVWLNEKQRITVLAHELCHVMYQHMLRRMNRDPEKWNIAADYVINAFLRKMGYSFDGLEWVLYDPDYAGMSTEEVYSLLPDPPAGSGGSAAVPMGPDGLPAFGQPGTTPNMAGDVLPTPKGQEQEVITTVVQASQIARKTKHWGDVPGEVKMTLDKFLNPIIPWQIRLRRFFTERAREDCSYSRPSRRNTDESFVMPSMLGDNGLTSLNYYLDVSGSITDPNVIRFNSEVYFIKKEFNPESLRLITFDTRIQNELIVPQDAPFDKVTITGRGGTNLEPVARHIEKTKPTAAIIFTDMHVTPMRRLRHNVPVLWVCVGNERATVPFGQLIHIPDEE